MNNRNKLSYSGIMTNYSCTAQCEHCMYCSSPKINKNYITAENSEKIALFLSKNKTTSVHIGGGEPFINFKGLCVLLEFLKKYNVGIDYIETNAFWCKSRELILERIKILKNLGVNTLMASVDPFHIEFVPLERPLLLCKTLDEVGMDYFIWQERFLRRLIKLDHTRVYSKTELQKILGENYITDTAREYGLGINGRALKIARKIYPLKKADEFLDSNGCTELLSGYHCHVDLYGNVIPSGCTGLSIDINDFFKDGFYKDSEKYPILSRLYSGGTKSLFEYACDNGFIPDNAGYCTKCELCYAMRSYLQKNKPSYDIAPSEFYSAMRDSLGF